MNALHTVIARIGAVLRFLREVANPRQTARAVPFGRVSIASVFLAATIFVGYSLTKQGLRLPGADHFHIEAELVDGAGLDATNKSPVAVAGVSEGRLVDVRYDHGVAVATLELDPDARGKVFRDARMRVRPFNAANVLSINIEPGTPAAGPLPEGGRIPATRTSVPVAADQLLRVFDADTRAYLQVVLGEASAALRGRGGEVARALREIGPLTDSAKQLSEMLRERRRLTSALVGELDTVFSTLARRRSQLASALDDGSTLLAAAGSHERELSVATRELPALLADARGALVDVRAAGPQLERGFAALVPPTRVFPAGLRSLRGLLPSVRRLFAAAGGLARDGHGPDARLRRLLHRLGRKSEPVISGVTDFGNVLKTFDEHMTPIRQAADVVSGLASTQDGVSPVGRFVALGIEPPKPENLGLSGSAALRNGHAQSPMERMLARGLDRVCARVNPLACIARFLTPGLADSVVSRAVALRPTPAVRSQGIRP